MTHDHHSLSRRDLLKLGAGAAAVALAPLGLRAEDLARGIVQSGLIEKPIPSSGEKIPVIGIGTARRYDVTTAEEKVPLKDVLRRFPEMGGKLIDLAPSYGQAETVVGEIFADLKNRPKYFVATKVAVGGRGGGGGDPASIRQMAVSQMEASMQKLHTDRFDLMQIHNMNNPATLLPLLREWKQAGRIRYLGITTSSEQQYGILEEVMKKEPMDFVQVDYAIDSREAADRILPLAKDRGMAVLTNLPFGRTRVFQKVQGKPLPDWAKEIDATSWAQIFLKYIVSHPSVTAAIPGTAKVEYLVDNLGAAKGRLPDAEMRKRIETYFDALPS